MLVQFKSRDWPLITVALERYAKALASLIKQGEKLNISSIEASKAEERTEANKSWLSKITQEERTIAVRDFEIADPANLVEALTVYDTSLEKVEDSQIELTVDPEDTKEQRHRVSSLIHRLRGQEEIPLADGETVEVVRE